VNANAIDAPESAPFTVVLTGGIASGKSAVSSLFAELCVPVVDTDLIAREVVQPGKPALAQVIEAFGTDFLLEDDTLNRRKLRARVFDDPDARKRLEAILHPAIRREAKRQISKTSAPYCILVIPLFAQSSNYEWVDRVLVVDVPEDLQISRVMERDGINEMMAKSILASQSSRDERLALADDVIENDGALEDLRAKVAELHRKYVRLAGRVAE
jgi:dephospho-CoA kinase